MNNDLKRLTKGIHHDFGQVKHLRTALTHRSYANEHPEEGEDNERLEFLGDAVIELTVSEEIYKRYPGAPEGDLTRVRSSLVKEASLAAIARRLDLAEFVLLGRGEESQGGRDRDSLMADTLEAVVGAVFLDGGFEVARRVVLALFQDFWPESPGRRQRKDHKSRLQEITQDQYQDRPVYTLKGADGPDHEKIFEVECALPDGRVFTGRGTSLKKAEQHAAAEAIDALTQAE